MPGHLLRRDAVGHGEDLQREVVLLRELACRERQAKQVDLLGDEFFVADDADQPQLAALLAAEDVRATGAVPEGLDRGLLRLAELSLVIDDEVAQLHFY